MRLLDLYCGAGGASVGYARAGFEVVGVDLHPQSRYPYEFHQADALSILRTMVDYPTFSGEMWRPGYFDAIHASPPCQAYSAGSYPNRKAGKEYPDLLGPTRELLQASGVPWVIENVPGAPMRADYRLCGCLFGLQVRRERWFETSWQGFNLRSPCHHVGHAVAVCGHGEPSRGPRRRLGLPGVDADGQRRAMGIDWMTRDELAQAIPPAYTEFIGEQLMTHLRAGVAA